VADPNPTDILDVTSAIPGMISQTLASYVVYTY